MQIAIIGLGRMGGNITRRLMRDGHECVVFDTDAKARQVLADEGARAVDNLQALREALQPPRTAWVMLPAGAATEQTIGTLAEVFERGDTVIDGGNSFYRDDIRHAAALGEHGIGFIDVGTSGGVWGLEEGYCMMIGGDAAAVQRLDPVFRTLAPGRGDIPATPGREGRDTRVEEGYMHTGPVGSGHFVKMVHNGIEYGVMQAYAEGFDILRNRDAEGLPEGTRYDLDLADVAEVWRRGSVIRSWLLDLTAGALAKAPTLEGYSGYVNDSGEGRWTVEAAVEEAVPAEVITAALFARFRSRREHTFAEKVLSAMRNAFGGHVEGGGH